MSADATSGAHAGRLGGRKPSIVEGSALSRLLADRRRHERERNWTERLSRIGADLLALASAFIVGGFIALIVNETVLGREYDALTTQSGVERTIEFGILGLVLVIFLASRGHYSSRHPFWTEVRDVALGALLFALADGFLQFAFKNQPSRLWLGISWALVPVMVMSMRLFVRRALRMAGSWNVRTLMIGEGSTAEAAWEALESEPYLGYQVTAQVGFSAFDPEAANSDAESRLASVGGSVGHAIAAMADESDAGFVVLAPSAREIDQLDGMVRHLDRLNLPYAVVPPIRGMSVLTLEPQHFYSHDVMMLTFRASLTHPAARVMKRAFDLAVSGFLVVLLAPFFLAMATAINSDGGPSFFRQERIGRNGRTFKCMKFRTMVTNAQWRLDDLLKNDPEAAAEWARDQKLRNDPRVTKVGAFLRRTSLDELPQLFNVLKGEMSLVGPRPIVADEVARYGDNIDYYLNSLPGITGLWQVSGRNDTTYQRRVELDRWYAQNWSLWQDIAILFKTFPALVGRRGAY